MLVVRLTRNARNSSILTRGCLDGVPLLSMHAIRCVLAVSGPKSHQKSHEAGDTRTLWRRGIQMVQFTPSVRHGDRSK